MQRGRHEHSVQICGEDCRYRKLYEGSQRSLTDMASRQAQAVSRVGRLRNQLVLAAKRAFPRAFGEAERAVGKRLSEVGDEVLVAYLESFMGSSLLAEEPPGVVELRQALHELGIPVPDSLDLSDWADAVRRHGGSGLLEINVHTPAIKAPTPQTQRTHVPNRSLTPSFSNSGPTNVEAPSSSIDMDLDALFGEAGEVFAQDLGSVAEESTADGSTGDPASDEIIASTQDLLVGDTDLATGNPLESSSPFEELDIFSDKSPFDDDSSNDPFSDLEAIPVNTGDGANEVGAPESDDVFEDAPVAAELPSNGDEVGAGQAVDESTNIEPQRESVPAWAVGRTVKPQLFPPSASVGGRATGRRERKPIRSRATPADVPDVPVDRNPLPVDGKLTDDLRQRILAACAVSRPIFMSDLIAMIGSEEVVQAWRQEQQDVASEVRFVLPKPRHRLRGALVVPQAVLTAANEAFSQSWWARTMQVFRGARLYELGVFFHRFSEQVISFENEGDDLIAVRMSLPSGLTGAILVAGQDLAEGGGTREMLVAAIERLLHDRLVHIAVMVTNAEQFDSVAAVIDAEAAKRGWRATMPVTLSRSWEYVDGTGTAVPLLGV